MRFNALSLISLRARSRPASSAATKSAGGKPATDRRTECFVELALRSLDAAGLLGLRS